MQEGSKNQAPADISSLLKVFDGDEELLRELVKDFVGYCPQIMAEIKESILKGDASQVQQKAHALKGVAGNFGAQVFLNKVVELELAGRELRIESAPVIFQELEEEMERVIEYLTYMDI